MSDFVPSCIVGRRLQFQKRRQLFIPRTTNRVPPSRYASVIQIVRPSESTADTHPQLQPLLLRLSAIISECFTGEVAFY